MRDEIKAFVFVKTNFKQLTFEQVFKQLNENLVEVISNNFNIIVIKS